jgi:hypothetical protein
LEHQGNAEIYREFGDLSAVISRKSRTVAIDPQNRLFARGRGTRLSAEQMRDQALVVSGLFSSKMYGPSVMPYQPENIWNSPYDSRKWVQNEGENQYRRAIYTYWKRTSAYPSMLIFDAMPARFAHPGESAPTHRCRLWSRSMILPMWRRPSFGLYG